MAGTFESSASRRLLLWLVAAKLALLILAFDPEGYVAFQLPKALASRACEWGTAAALAFAFVAYGTRILPRTRLHVFVLALLAANVAAAAFAADRYAAIFGDPENYAGLTFLVDMAVLYLAVAVAVRADRDAMLLLAAVVGAGLVALAYGAVQAIGLDPFSWQVVPTSRPFSTFGNPDHFGHFLSVLFAVLLGTALARNGSVRWAAAVATVGAVAVAAVVATRGTLIGFAAAIVGAATSQGRAIRGAAVGAAGLAALALVLAATPLGQRAIATLGTPQDRIALYEIALRASLVRPVLGYGPDNFRVAFADQRTVESLPVIGSGPQATAHDWLLDASATTGVIGLLALVALVLVGTMALWRAARQPGVGLALFLGWLAYWSHGLVAATSMAAIWYPWLALGAVAGLTGSRVRDARIRSVPAWATVILTALALVGAASGARAFHANRDAWTSTVAAHFDDPDALMYADRAAARDPGRADNWNRLGLALEAQKRDVDAANAYREAAGRAPYEAVYWSNLARAIARTAGSDSAKREDALAAARHATAVDRNAPLGHVALAEIAIVFGRCDLAIAEAAYAASLEPGHDPLVARARSCH